MPIVGRCLLGQSGQVTQSLVPKTPGRRVHPAWIIAAVAFVAVLAAAGFRSVPGVLMDPLHSEFGWSHGTIGLAMSINMTLFGLTAPFAAALMDRFGVRPVLAVALTLIAAGTFLAYS
ncbi:Major Facilitator Superfamily protein [Mycobacteroides salmoniphilum]|nr:Major Facilitator Superfamily protein [Mycobacteroides salmoniphilum]